MSVHAGMTGTDRAAVLTPATVRRVWATVSRCPRLSLREVALQTQLSLSTVYYALLRLRDANYIAFNDGEDRARTILVPFYVEDL